MKCLKMTHFPALNIPQNSPLSVADEPPATPPSPQNDTPYGDHSIPHTPTPRGRWPQGIFLVASSAFGDNQKTLHPRPGQPRSPSNSHPQRSEGSHLCWWESLLFSECLATAVTMQSYCTLPQVYPIWINSPLPWKEGWAGGPLRAGIPRHPARNQTISIRGQSYVRDREVLASICHPRTMVQMPKRGRPALSPCQPQQFPVA